jgi:hypothetical protein
MLAHQDPEVSRNATLWNESKQVNHELKLREGQWQKIVKLNCEKELLKEN